jgi:hypothetical protein
MRFITMIKSAERKYGPPPPALMAGLAKLGEDATKAGVLVETGGLMGSDKGALLRLTKDKKIAITDGPFAEAKELIGGYAIYETKTKEEAVEWCKRFLAIHSETWPGWEGEVELRQLMEFGPPK